MEEAIGKVRKTQPLLPSKIIANNAEVNEDKQIVTNLTISL